MLTKTLTKKGLVLGTVIIVSEILYLIVVKIIKENTEIITADDLLTYSKVIANVGFVFGMILPGLFITFFKKNQDLKILAGFIVVGEILKITNLYVLLDDNLIDLWYVSLRLFNIAIVIYAIYLIFYRKDIYLSIYTGILFIIMLFSNQTALNNTVDVLNISLENIGEFIDLYQSTLSVIGYILLGAAALIFVNESYKEEK
ncbi:MAG: hypothetical protein QM489_06845 [Candidatus Izemoplasma sp.]